jgi:cell division transport system permease protein
LLLSGVFIFIFFNIRYLSDYYKEQLSITVFFHAQTSADQIQTFVKKSAAVPFVKQVDFVDRQRALEIFLAHYQALDKESIEPEVLPESVQIYLRSDHVDPIAVEQFVTFVRNDHIVDEVVYDQELLAKMTDNLHKLQVVFFGILLLLFSLSVILVNNTVKVAVFGKRFLIRTMLLVGARPVFVYTPYLKTFFRIGLSGAMLANLTLAGFIYLISRNYPTLSVFFQPSIIFQVFILLIFLGIIVTLGCARWALGRYVRAQAHQIF